MFGEIKMAKEYRCQYCGSKVKKYAKTCSDCGIKLKLIRQIKAMLENAKGGQNNEQKN